MSELQLHVTDVRSDGIRLDRYCSQNSGTISRSRLKNGATLILINGTPTKLSKTVHNGDIITLQWEDPPAESITPENIPLNILFENEDVTVVNKAQGMVTHPAIGNWNKTLVNALLWHWKISTTTETQRPGIVHRLDKDTSGIIITARTIDCETYLQKQFSSRKVKKIYAAILCGIPKEKTGDIKTQLIRDTKNRKKFTTTDHQDKGKFSHTGYKVVACYGPYSLVLFTLYTGRTHQIRVHSKFIGCPILGDPIYGKKDARFPSATLMLHAKKLQIVLPNNESPSVFSAPIPLRFKKVISALRETYERT
jgi:23S rRNA pseudouridine1911/1915/1917 synthase